MLMLLMSILQINILGIFGAQAKSVENTRLNMKVEKATIVQVFKEIEKQTQFHFSFFGLILQFLLTTTNH